jgi:hypothetical protein
VAIPPDLKSPSHDEVDDDDDEAAKKKKKKNTNLKAEPLPCSHSQFITIQQELLVFHAWFKCGALPR